MYNYGGYTLRLNAYGPLYIYIYTYIYTCVCGQYYMNLGKCEWYLTHALNNSCNNVQFVRFLSDF